MDIAKHGVEWAREKGRDVLIVDTAGRLHIDETLMDELVRIRNTVKPHNILLVLDAMTGQDAVNVALQFQEKVQFDGVVLTKMDGDARGGAALSVRAVTGKPIKFASSGEKLDNFEYFHPDRVASRILGMGDVLSLIEKAERTIDEKKARELEQKLRKSTFTFDDFLDQIQQVRKMGSISSLLGMIPGIPSTKLKGLQVDDRAFDKIQAVICSHDRGGASPSRHHQRQPSPAHRRRLGLRYPGGQPVAHPVQAGAEDDEAAGFRPYAQEPVPDVREPELEGGGDQWQQLLDWLVAAARSVRLIVSW